MQKKYVAQQRVQLIEKEGIFKVFCQANGCFHYFEFQDLPVEKFRSYRGAYRRIVQFGNRIRVVHSLSSYHHC